MTNSLMTNIIYDAFLNEFFKGTGSIDLTIPNTLKIALLKPSYVPVANGEITYYQLSLADKECKDCYDIYDDNPSKGYKKGGKPITLKKRDTLPEETGKSSFYCDESIYWSSVSLYGENAVGSALIYRVSDGLPICCFAFDIPKEVGNETSQDNLELRWDFIDIMSIQTDTPIIKGLDSELDENSENPVQNSTITRALNGKISKLYDIIEKYGIRLNGEFTPTEDDDNPDGDSELSESNVDALNRIDNNFIDSFFPDDDAGDGNT